MTEPLVVPVRREYGTMVIAICFIVLAYILDPIVQTAYRRFRAYRAWKAIQNNETVEVTDYPIVAEVLWGRGKLDTGRVVAFLTLLFSAASLTLEIQLNITNVERSPVDVFDRPPPVTERGSSDGTNIYWEVLNKDDFHEMKPEGYLENFKERNETQDSILEIGESKSLYRRINDTDDLVRGVVVTNSWSSNVHHANYKLYYDGGDGVQRLDDLVCREEGGDTGGDVMDIFEDEKLRGNVTQCNQGPNVYNRNDSNRHPPTIILRTRENGEYLIVEENGGYPGFFYSVWSVTDNIGSWVEVSHVFYIESRFRLVEAIITGVVYGFKEAGKCVDLMMQYSNEHEGYENKTRAHPFGEHPESSVVPSLSDVEPIPRGLATDAVGISSLALLGILSVVGIVPCLCVQSKIGMDIYDRDELIRSVTLPNQNTEEEKLSSMRMFVRKDETGHIDVIISDVGNAVDRCTGYFRRPNVVAHDEPAVATAVGDNGNGVIPIGPRQRRLEGMRLGLGRTNFPRDFPITLSLTSSPLPSATCTPEAGPTPARDRTQELTVARGKMALCESSNTITRTNLTRGMRVVYPVSESSAASNMESGTLAPDDTPGRSRTPLGIMTSPALTRGPHDVSRRSPAVLPYLEGVLPFSRSRSNAEDRSDSDTTFPSVGSENV